MLSLDRRSCLLTLFVSWFVACSSSNHGGSQKPIDSGVDGEVYGNEAGTRDAGDAGDDGGYGDPSCVGSRCADGQKCEAASGEPRCVPTCDAVSCPPGKHCRIDGRYGQCVDRCEPDCGSGQRCEAGTCKNV